MSTAISWRRGYVLGVWAYCLTPNHVRLIFVPDCGDTFARAIAAKHRRYCSAVNARLRVTGRPFQSRFASLARDDEAPKRGCISCHGFL
jgi:putative transposase